MTYSKHCKHQPCPQPMQCGIGCYADTPHNRATAANVSRDFHEEPCNKSKLQTLLSDTVGTFIAVGALFNHEPPGLYRAYLVAIFGAVGYGLYRYFF